MFIWWASTNFFFFYADWKSKLATISSHRFMGDPVGNQSLEGPLQTYVDRNSKMTTTAGHSFYIGPIGSFYNKVNDTGSWEPLVCVQWVQLRWKVIVHFVVIGGINDQHCLNFLHISFRNIWHVLSVSYITCTCKFNFCRDHMVVGFITTYIVCNQCLSPLMLWVWIPLRRGVLDTT